MLKHCEYHYEYVWSFATLLAIGCFLPIRATFPAIADHIINVLKRFKMHGTQISFSFNDQKIDHKDVNIKPLFLDIINSVEVFVDIVSVCTDDSLVNIE
uniref:Uncharacterized protein n=1 Tax=Tetranychus urticae TaxID=32264 RepID=T1KPP1_TETUR